MSTPSPAKVVHGVEEEEEMGMGTTPVKVRRGAEEEEERGATATGTTPVKVIGRGVHEEEKGSGTTPVKVPTSRVEEERGKAHKSPVNVKAEPGGGDGGSLINIKVHSQTAAEVFFRVKRDVKLRRLIDMYCRKHSLDPKAVKFLGPNGSFLRAEQTLEEVGLEDGDEISLVLDQQGGGGAPPVHASQFSA